MKKGVVILFILLLFPLVSSIEFEIKNNFSKGETLIAKLSGNFQDRITKDNIIFYRDGHVKIPIIFDIVEIEDEFYIYALLSGKESGEYSISLEEIKYYKQGEIVDDSIVQEFTILNNFADFSIKPGFIVTDKTFSVEIQNLLDNKLTIKINENITKELGETNVSEDEEGGLLDLLLGNLFLALTGKVSYNLDEEFSIDFKSGEKKTIEFELGDIPEPILKTITFSSDNLDYNLPVYISREVLIQEDYIRKLTFEPIELKFSLDANMSSTKIVTIHNTGNESLENITLTLSNSLDNYISISPNNFDLGINSSQDIELNFTSSNISQIILGELTARIPNETEDLSIIFEIISGEYIENNTSEPARSKICEELNGTICDNNQECSGEIRYAKDGNCCLEECVDVKESNTKMIIGWIIIIAIILALAWFFKFKYKKARGEIDLFKIAKGK